ncbi:E3 ubiquitin protein ligase DRIP2-like isoform X1 [Vitis riparia]|uniref:E3 ubiquitin protein ligase DRIP2-like isoform X1 n=1 Tax=Vitis riparia TaxID=96939 RepID=UPI00155ADF20|nr:E3 ubiquitin protein ligase DRIP2-like isoform X1 [Vitis riparia]
MMSGPVAKVPRERLAACMTCRICNKLFDDATTISECLHTFCRKCIFDKITEDELDYCPVCNTNLGCAPLEKLRPDHNLQDLTAKIFPSEKSKVIAPEEVASVPLPARRKERSLSSLGVSTPRVSSQTVMTGKRTKSAARRLSAARESTFPVEEPIKKEEDYPENPSSPEILNKRAQNKKNLKENYSSAESSKQHINKGKEENSETLKEKDDMWKPLNCLVEACSGTKSNKLNLQGSLAKSTPSHVDDKEAHVPKAKLKERGKLKFQDEENGTTHVPSGSVKPRIRGGRQKKAATPEGFSIPALAENDGNSKCNIRACPVWFSLVASDNQEGDAPLPQIPSSYLRMRDGHLPVSFLQKYLVQKLHLNSESEVEITLRGQPVVPTLQLQSLVDLWFQATAPTTSEATQPPIGSSAKEFVMVLSYGRKPKTP